MKKLKILIATILVFVLTFALTACSAPVVGEWEITEINANGEIFDKDDLEEYGGSMTLEVNADGTCTLTESGSGESYSIDMYWTFEDDTLFLYADEDKEGEALQLEYKDGKLTLELDGAKCVFEKK